MSYASEYADELFRKAALGDGDNGYPPKVAFVAEDQEGAARAFYRNVWEGTPTVVVTPRGGEILVVPEPRAGVRGTIDRLRGRVRVRVGARGDLWSDIELYSTIHAHRRRGMDRVLEHAPA